MDFETSFQRAQAAAGKAKPVLIRTPFLVYKLTPKNVAKWAASYYRVSMLDKIGAKALYQQSAGEWKIFPWSRENPSIKSDSKEGKRIIFESIPSHDNRERERSFEELRAAITKAQQPKKNDMRHWKAIAAESKKVGWPTMYATDVAKHDKTELTYRDPDLAFGWILRDAGSHLIPAEDATDRGSPGNWVEMIKRSFGIENSRFYVWDGVSLREMKPEAWREWMDRQHRKMKGEKDED